MLLRSRLRASFGAACLLFGVNVLVAGCAGSAGSESIDGSPLVTLEECREIGGSPLFDPDDGRPIEQSCPDGLSFLGEFEEPFFGSDGGLCCGGPEDRAAPRPAGATAL